MKQPIVQRDAKTWRLPGVIAAAVIVLLGLGLIWWVLTQDGSASALPVISTAPQARGLSTTSSPNGQDQSLGTPSSNQRQQLERQLADAKQRLESYRAATRYPPESQPITPHSDVLKPFDPVVEERQAISAQGAPVTGRHLIATQDRVYVSGKDSVLLTVAMRDDQNHAAPLRVIRATAREMPDAGHPPTTVSPVAMQFEDHGANGDALAGDGVYSARLQPAAQSFASTQGTIRIDLDLQSDTGGPAHTFFDVIYMPNVPATWGGSVREVMEQGSLAFYVKAEMREAGRYIVTARAYDATGKPFALLSFNDEVPAGSNEIRLTLFGKLVRDAKPVFPITLRDIDGFVLYEGRFPDRAMMARWPQTAYTSHPHALSEFADAEWTSDQRTRYLDEFTKDANLAADKLQSLQGQ
jgi:TolA-binding protein